jgi:KaiC/GvpD/RAD55 family RecA-like ATPase
MADTILGLRTAEIGGHVRNTVTALKMRGSAHGTEMRPFRITSEGIMVEGRRGSFHPTYIIR